MAACRAQISPHLLAFITLGIRFCFDDTWGVGHLGGNSENDEPSGLPLGDGAELWLAPTQGKQRARGTGAFLSPSPSGSSPHRPVWPVPFLGGKVGCGYGVRGAGSLGTQLSCKAQIIPK